MRALIVSRRQAGEKPHRIASAIGVSVATLRKWLARHAAAGVAGLADRSSRPHRVQARATDGQRAEVAAVRRARQPFWSAGMTATGPKECPNASQCRPVARHCRPDRKVLRIEPLVGASPQTRDHPLRKGNPRRDDPYRHQEAGPHRRHPPPHHRRPHRPKQPARAQSGRQALGSSHGPPSVRGPWRGCTWRRVITPAWPIARSSPTRPANPA